MLFIVLFPWIWKDTVFLMLFLNIYLKSVEAELEEAKIIVWEGETYCNKVSKITSE